MVSPPVMHDDRLNQARRAVSLLLLVVVLLAVICSLEWIALVTR